MPKPDQKLGTCDRCGRRDQVIEVVQRPLPTLREKHIEWVCSKCDPAFALATMRPEDPEQDAAEERAKIEASKAARRLN